MPIDVSIILVNWNTREVLKNCLTSVFSETKNISFEVIVVDNHSHDQSCEMIEQEFPQVKLIKNTQNAGFAAANNQAIREASGQHILLLNNDTLVLDDVIAKSIEYLNTHPDVGVMGCRVLNDDKSHQSTCFMYPSILNLFLLSSCLSKVFSSNRFFGRERMACYDWTQEHSVQVVAGCYMLIKKNALDQVGYMDEDFFMYCEETDWCYRFKKAGWNIHYAPVGEIIHLGKASSSKIPYKMLLQMYGSVLLFFKKHKSLLEVMTACLFVSLYFAVRLPFWLIKFCISRSKDERQNSLNMLLTCIKGTACSLLAGRFMRIERT